VSGNTSVSYVTLGEVEVGAGRAFTHPGRSAEDLGALRYMAGRIRELLLQPEPRPGDPYPRILFVTESGGRIHRMILCNRLALLEANALSMVGFFGQRSATTTVGPLMDALDLELIAEFAQHPAILCYCSLELEPGGNWGNLVLLSHTEAKSRWAQSERHVHAAQMLAPQYYCTVRIHNAELPGGLMTGGEVMLVRTKYYDYQQEPTWRAVRELNPAQRFVFD
jgi:hypothetical protein